MVRGEFKIFRCGIAGIEAVASDTRHIFPRHTHEHFGIGVIDRGAQKSHSGRGMVEAGAGDTITVNPGEVHDGTPIGDDGRTWRMLYFEPWLIADAAGDISEGRVSNYEFVRPAFTNAAIARRFSALFDVVVRGHRQITALRREELLTMLLPQVMCERPDVDGEHLIPAGIRLAKQTIDDCPTEPITLSELARASGLSRYQLLRKFAKAIGLTPHAYLIQRRIEVARRMIAAGTSLAEAAVAAGFADQSHMTRTFVRKYGISPGAYAGAAI